MSYSTHGSMSRSTHGSKGASIIYVNFTSGGKLLMGYWKQQCLLVSSSNIVRCNAPPDDIYRAGYRPVRKIATISASFGVKGE
jgi:hypothetical protein